MATVTFDHVTKAYADGTVAVDDLDLLIKDGEFLVLVGPSGCGKTTALRCVAGLEEITGGQIKIDARVVNRVPSKDRNIAMVFQSYALYPHMTVFDNLAFGLKLMKTPKQDIKRRVEDAAKILNLESLLDRKPRALSGGQRQRVALGRAIVREPAAFLMDEPLSNLDAKLRVQTRAEILRLQRRLETTTIYVTHDQVEAMTMGDRIAVMNHGVLQQIGSPPELYDNPVNRFVAAFIGSPAMNFATAKAGEGHLTLGGTTLHLTGRAAKAAEQNRGRDLTDRLPAGGSRAERAQRQRRGADPGQDRCRRVPRARGAHPRPVRGARDRGSRAVRQETAARRWSDTLTRAATCPSGARI